MGTGLYGGEGKIAKHTSYDNHWFRSKLEAQWAVVFDELDLRWRYEGQWLRFGAKQFLPDFHIEDWNSYIEIKPRAPGFSDNLSNVLRRYSRMHSDFTCLLISGSPGFRQYDIRFFQHYHPQHGSGGWLFGDDGTNKGDIYLAQADERPIFLTSGSTSAAGAIHYKWPDLSGRLRLALGNGQIGPPQIRKGRFIHPKSDCPFCKNERSWLINHMGMREPTPKTLRSVRKAIFN